MNKKVLLLYSLSNQSHLVINVVERMRKLGVCIDAFNVTEWNYVCGDKSLPFSFRILRHLLCTKLFAPMVRHYVYVPLLLRVSKEYDYVDIHFFAYSYLPFLKRLQKPYKITIWGSDFYRESKDNQEAKRLYYRNAVMVQVETEEVKRDLVKFEPSLAEKVVVCNFGVDILDSIFAIVDDSPLVKESSRIGRTVVTVGYNGSKGQQHLLLIRALDALPRSYKERLFIYIPATYGLTPGYKRELLYALEQIQIPYHLFENRLSEPDLAKLRKESDIALNAQITDTLCASLLQHLYAGSIVIVGEWLPYGIFDRHNIVYFKATKDGFKDRILYCLDHINDIKASTKGNSNKVLEFATWNAVSNKQYDIYRALFS